MSNQSDACLTNHAISTNPATKYLYNKNETSNSSFVRRQGWVGSKSDLRVFCL